MKKIFAVTFVTLSLLLFALTSYAPAQTQTPRADFVINCAQKTLSAPAGATVSFQLSLTPVNGFNGSATFECIAGTPGVSCRAPEGTVRLGPSLVVPFEITAKADTKAPVGTYPIIVTVKGNWGATAAGSVSHNEILYLSTP
jgi:hypothetical protein